MKHIFICNPYAGEADKFISALETNIKNSNVGSDAEIYITRYPKDATEYVYNRLKNNNGENLRFYACGGDGTLSEVVNGVMQNPAISDFAEVGALPYGSGNDFVKVFGEADFFDLNAQISSPSVKSDVIKINDRYGINSVHFGLDGYVAYKFGKVKRKKYINSKNAYNFTVLRAFLFAMKTNCYVKTDSGIINNGKILLCALSNGKYVGGKYKCTPYSEYNDGLLEVCLAKPISRLKFISLMKYYEKGLHIDSPKLKDIIVYHRSANAEITSPKPIPVSVDGEVIHGTHFSVSVLHNAINLIVPYKNFHSANTDSDN